MVGAVAGTATESHLRKGGGGGVVPRCVGLPNIDCRSHECPISIQPSALNLARSDAALRRKRETLDLRISWVSLWFKGLRQCIRDITYALWHTAHGFRTHGASVLTLSTGPRSVQGMQTYARPASRACSGSWCTACAARRASRGYADVARIPANRNTRCS